MRLLSFVIKIRIYKLQGIIGHSDFLSARLNEKKRNKLNGYVSLDDKEQRENTSSEWHFSY